MPDPYGQAGENIAKRSAEKEKGPLKPPFPRSKHKHERTSIEIQDEPGKHLQDFSVSGLTAGSLLKQQ
jgi:hypothetical protein